MRSARSGECGSERAKYEADLAERRYDVVDPHNRLIAATLEQRWNQALQRLRDLEAELSTFEQQTMRAVTAEQKQQILQLVKERPPPPPRIANASCGCWCATSPS